ncbi:MAG: hypothetical protein LH603_22075, partial [Pseudonocardia sp.]|nr:hypothetical protein [Pseudonocardia sp.]
AVEVRTLSPAGGEGGGGDPGAFARACRPARGGVGRRFRLPGAGAGDELGLSAATGLTAGLRTTLEWVRTLTAAERTS